ncbi:MAG: VOC family protein [Terriglobales bacterium]
MPVAPVPEGYHTVTPYLTVRDARQLIEFVRQAFGATLRTEPMQDPSGRVAHAEVQLGDSVVMLGEPMAGTAPRPSLLHLYLPDVDAAYERALAAGAKSVRAPEDQFYGDRSAGVEDGNGNQWWLATHVEDLSEAEMRRRAAAKR